MKMQPFVAEVRQRDDVVIIDMKGEVNAFAESGLSAAIKEAEVYSPPVIVLNFTEVNYINSTGIALIVGILAQARKAHRKLVVFGLSDHYVTIFQITVYLDFMAVYRQKQRSGGNGLRRWLRLSRLIAN
jgi:anti-anti-sigma factor